MENGFVVMRDSTCRGQVGPVRGEKLEGGRCCSLHRKSVLSELGCTKKCVGCSVGIGCCRWGGRLHYTLTKLDYIIFRSIVLRVEWLASVTVNFYVSTWLGQGVPRKLVDLLSGSDCEGVSGSLTFESVLWGKKIPSPVMGASSHPLRAHTKQNMVEERRIHSFCWAGRPSSPALGHHHSWFSSLRTLTKTLCHLPPILRPMGSDQDAHCWFPSWLGLWPWPEQHHQPPGTSSWQTAGHGTSWPPQPGALIPITNLRFCINTCRSYRLCFSGTRPQCLTFSYLPCFIWLQEQRQSRSYYYPIFHMVKETTQVRSLSEGTRESVHLRSPLSGCLLLPWGRWGGQRARTAAGFLHQLSWDPGSRDGGNAKGFSLS